MSASAKSKTKNPLKSSLISLVAVGFIAGIFMFTGLALVFVASGMATSLLAIILIFVSLTGLLITVRIYAHISLNLAQNDQKHLQNALIQAKDMLDTSKQLREDHILLQSLQQNLPFPIWLKDRFGRYLVANNAFTQQWCNGIDPIGRTDDELLNETLAATFSKDDQLALQSGQAQKLELRLDLPNQVAKWVRIERYALRGEDNNNVGVLGFAFDISRYKSVAVREPDYLKDSLTAFANQAGLNRYVEQHAELHNKTWCLHIDIDHFKVVNDSLGHESGDRLLLQIAERILKASNISDFLSRPSADEFILFWYQDDNENMAERLDNLHAQLNQPLTIGDAQYSFTCSIGAAKSPDDGDDAATLLHRADIALFNAKKRGRNQIHWYHSDYQHQAMRRLTKQQALQQAIHGEELDIHVQPRIDSRSGEIEALECLVRIPVEDGNLMYPGNFIELAEQTGLIRPLDDFMLDRALLQIQRWLSEGIQPIPLAVNLSIQSFNAALVDKMTDLHKKQPECLSYLELELTEHRLPDNDGQFLGYLKALTDLGIRLALDDFGTGYANLSRLPEWPFQLLKLDRSFVVDLANSEKQQTVVQSIVEMCQKLDIEVVAEGVETETELTAVNQLGCHSIQGYLYAHPTPISNIQAWLMQRKITSQ